MRRKVFINVFKYAAIFIVTIGLSYIFLIDNFSFTNNEEISNESKSTETKILPGLDKATLTLEDGSEVILEKGKKISEKEVIKKLKEKLIVSTINRNRIHSIKEFITRSISKEVGSKIKK